MTINKTINGTQMYAAVQGRIDTVTVSEAESILRDGLDGVTDLTLDFKELDYISSAGLRLLLSLQKTMSAKGSMRIKNVNEIVMEIFEVTGFSEILTVE